MIKYDERVVESILRELIRDVARVEKTSKTLKPKPAIMLYTGGSSCNYSKEFLNYLHNSDVGHLISKKHYNYNLLDLIDVREVKNILAKQGGIDNSCPAIPPNYTMEVIDSSITYTCSKDETLHIYTIGGGGGFVYNASDRHDFGIGKMGELDYIAYNATAGEKLDIVIGDGGVNQTDTVVATDGQSTTISSQSTTLFITSQGGNKGSFGDHDYETRLTRHWFNPSYGDVVCDYYKKGNGLPSSILGWIGTGDIAVYPGGSNPDTYFEGVRMVTTIPHKKHYDSLDWYSDKSPKYGRQGISKVEADDTVTSGTQPLAGCVLLIREYEIC